MWLQMDQWMDRPMDEWINERTSEWTMFFSYTDAMDASENDDFPTDFAIFTEALGINGPTDQWTDIPSYRDAWTHLKRGKKRETQAFMINFIGKCHFTGNDDGCCVKQ